MRDILSAAAMEYRTPPFALDALAPVLIVFGVAVAGVLVEAFVARRIRRGIQVALSLVGVVAALAALVWYGMADGRPILTAGQAVVVDGPTLYIQGTILILALLSLLVAADRAGEAGDAFAPQAAAVPGSALESQARDAGVTTTEVFPLMMFSLGGMMLMPASHDLLTMFVALEVLSLPLYLLCGLARRRRMLSQEASLKYFLLGAFSSGFFLYGVALIYGYAGSISLDRISYTIRGLDVMGRNAQLAGGELLLLLGAGLLLVGLLFKVSAAPFHVWTPDVYQGAPTPITGFMAACTKVAAFGALLRIAYMMLPGLQWDVQPVLLAVAVLTMLVGSVVAIVQADVKRMLAYSSIAHAGFLLVGVLAMDVTGVRGVLFYLLAYGLTTVAAFAVVTMVRVRADDGGIGGEATHLSQWAGLGRRSPLVAGLFTLLLLSFAGIPLTSGFIGKYGVFAAALAHFTTGVPYGGVIGVGVGVLASVIAAFFYVRVIVLMYFSEPVAETATVSVPGPMTAFAIALGVGGTILFGVYPNLVMDVAERLSLFLP